MFNLPSIRTLLFILALLLGAMGSRVSAQTSPTPAAGTTRDIHDIHSLAPLTYWERNGTLIVCSSLAGIVFLTFLLSLVFSKKAAIRLTPYQIALRQLDAARAFAIQGDDKAFAIAASNAVRRYLENAYRMPAPERTTEEFLLEAARNVWLHGEPAALLRRFLEFCDLAKFAGQQFGQDERDQLLKAAREFIDTAEKAHQPPPPATAGTSKNSGPPPLPPAKKPVASTLTTS